MEGLAQDQTQLKEYRLMAGRFRLDQITLNQMTEEFNTNPEFKV
jgi:hypothetical protein|tara:strand:+ start:307 stop:438 length:132 start_codon:yes stop_codon:yes gene_type:complete